MSFLFWGKETPKQSPRPSRPPVAQTKVKKTEPVRKNEEEIFKEIEENFFKDPTEIQFDPLDHLIETLPLNVTAEELEKLIGDRKEQLEIVNSKLHQNVISNYNEFVKGMIQIRELGVDLETTVQLCRDGRSILKKADHNVISAPAKIISSNRKRKLYQSIVTYLAKIKVIHRTEVELRKFLEDFDYLKAIEGYKEFSKDVVQLKEFYCVRELTKESSKFEKLIQDKLDATLLELTRNFSENSYEKILQAYKLSDNSHRVATKLQQYFAEAVSTSTSDLLYAFVLMSEENAGKAEQLKKLPFSALCNKLPDELFVPCIQRMFEYLLDLMYSHYQMREWHLKKEEAEDETGLFYKEVRINLERFSKSLWDQMQNQHVILLLKNTSLPNFKIESFLAILDAVNKLIEFGEEFSGSTASNLRTCINQQSRTYFSNFHKKKLDHLKEMLENERWEAMPVHDGFSADDIREIRNFLQTEEESEKSNKIILKRNISTNNRDVSALASLYITGNPFREKKTRQENVEKQEGSDDEDEELKQEFVAEEGVNEELKQKPKPKSSKFQSMAYNSVTSITIACVNLIRYIGNYLQMMQILQPIAFEVFQGVIQLYEYYLYVLVHFFCRKPPIQAPTAQQSTLKDLFQRTSANITALTDEIISSDNFIDALSDQVLRAEFTRIHSNIFGSDKPSTVSSQLPSLSTEIDIHSSNSMYGLNHRTVAVDSLQFLANCLNCLKPSILKILPRNHTESVNNFFAHSIDIVPSIRNIIVANVVEKLLNVTELPSNIEKVKNWAANDIGTEHNNYVNLLIEEFRMLNIKLQQVVAQGIVSEQVKAFLTERCISLCMDQLVEGYSRIKKCSNEGRTQMSLDFQVFLTALKEITGLKQIPKQSHVENFIKAFYFDTQVLDWIKQNKDEYTGKQLLGLGTLVSTRLNRKDVKEFMKSVEDITKKI